MTPRSSRIVALVLIGSLQAGILTASALAADAGFTRYTDPEQRFSFDYPATMKVRAAGNDEVKVTHPGATLRITVLVEKRRRTAPASAEALLDAFKRTLKEEMKGSTVLEEGKLLGLQGSQGYIVCSFKDLRGIPLVQLVQYYVTEDHVLRMIISDVPEGFKNVEKVIRKIHQSLRILNPKLK
ncbi:MAG: hypothetical protein ACLP5H_09160 [Desulfomonilaceae bacterium]